MHCADDPADQPLSDELISERAAALCDAAENAWKELPVTTHAPVYVVGTEVPIPGGAHADDSAPQVTNTTHLQRTLDLTKATFRSRGLDHAWERVIAVVVHPGVEFIGMKKKELTLDQVKRAAAFALPRDALDWHL